jgi:hypothetical protein
VLIAMLGSVVVVLDELETVDAQQPASLTNTTNANLNFTRMFQEKYPDKGAQTTVGQALGSQSSLKNQTVYVRYESPTTLVIKGDLIRPGGEFNSDLWEAQDMLKNQYGFKLQQVFTNERGKGTSVYLLMTK